MSNFLSAPYEKNTPRTDDNFSLLAKVMEVKQGRYDANKAKIDQTLALYQNNLRGLRDADNQYITERIKEAQNIINNYGNRDFSSTTNTETLLSSLRSITEDPIVQSAVLAKAKKDAYDLKVDEIRKKDPKAYNDANYKYGLYQAGEEEYMQGKTNTLGNLNYTPYTDLTEEHLKKLKTIKDVKGKRFIEEQAYDTNGEPIPGKLVRKEIDGLTESEISNYFGSIITSQELNQMKINGWAKYGQPSVIDKYRGKLSEFNTLTLKQKEAEYEKSSADANNNTLDKKIKDDALRKANELQEEIKDLKAFDVKKLRPEDVGFSLEKSNYLNGLTEIAKSEWSVEYKKDDYYFESQKLDIARQELELKKEKEAIKNGAVVEGAVSFTPADTALSETLSENEVGATTLRTEHDSAYNTIVNTAKEFLQKAPKEDKENFLKYLKAREIGEDLSFTSEDKKKKYSLATTIYEAFKDGDFDTTYSGYGSTMKEAIKTKKQKAKDILQVSKEGYSLFFNKDSKGYINSLKSEIKTAMIDGQSDLFDNEKALELAKNAQEFVNNNGGWDKLEENLKNNPNKLSKMADLLDKLTSRATTSINLNFSRKNLKKDASAEIEKIIQTKTKSGAMMSAYMQANLVNDDLRDNIVKMIPEAEVTDEENKKTYEVFDPKQNVTISKEGKDIYLRQVKTIGSGDSRSSMVIKYKVNEQSTMYNQLSSYMNLSSTTGDFMKADKDTEYDEVKPRMANNQGNDDIVRKKMVAIQNNISPDIKKVFAVDPILLATKETAKQPMIDRLVRSGVKQEDAEKYVDTLLNKVNTYKLRLTTELNDSGDDYNFKIDVKKSDGSSLFSKSLGVSTIDKKTDYLLDSYSHIFILNQKIIEAAMRLSSISELTSSL